MIFLKRKGYVCHNNWKSLLQTVATNGAGCLSWPNTSREMFWASRGKHCFYTMRAFSLDGFELQKISSYMYSIIHKFFITSCFLYDTLVYIKCYHRFILFPPKSDWHFCEDLRVEGAIEGVGHHPKSEAREDCHWTLKMNNSILTEAPLCTTLSF